jgi:hypothetical protein
MGLGLKPSQHVLYSLHPELGQVSNSGHLGPFRLDPGSFSRYCLARFIEEQYG